MLLNPYMQGVMNPYGNGCGCNGGTTTTGNETWWGRNQDWVGALAGGAVAIGGMALLNNSSIFSGNTLYASTTPRTGGTSSATKKPSASENYNSIQSEYDTNINSITDNLDIIGLSGDDIDPEKVTVAQVNNQKQNDAMTKLGKEIETLEKATKSGGELDKAVNDAKTTFNNMKEAYETAKKAYLYPAEGADKDALKKAYEDAEAKMKIAKNDLEEAQKALKDAKEELTAKEKEYKAETKTFDAAKNELRKLIPARNKLALQVEEAKSKAIDENDGSKRKQAKGLRENNFKGAKDFTSKIAKNSNKYDVNEAEVNSLGAFFRTTASAGEQSTLKEWAEKGLDGELFTNINPGTNAYKVLMLIAGRTI